MVTSSAMPPSADTRSPERTRARILSAATDEFAARGFAGARVDAIARRARINKRMLYHYFGDKQQLFQAVLRDRLADKARYHVTGAVPLEQALPTWFEILSADPKWVRLMQWEALAESPVIVLEAERRAALAQAARVLAPLPACRAPKSSRSARREGSAAPPIDAASECGALGTEEVLLLTIALSSVPRAFSQLVRLVTGSEGTSPAFHARWRGFLAAVGRELDRGRAEERGGRTSQVRARAPENQTGVV